MQINNKLTGAIVLAGSLCIITAVGVASGLNSERPRLSTIGQLDKACLKNIDDEGFGHAALGNTNLQNESGLISVNCKIRLKAGTTLQMNNVRLETKNLLIEDASFAKRPSHIDINNSSFISSVGGFQIKLNAPKSTVAVNGSTLSYNLSVGISVGQTDKDIATNLVVKNSTMRSKSTTSEGIVLVSIGLATFENNHFELADQNSKALLLGAHCNISANTNANDTCQGSE